MWVHGCMRGHFWEWDDGRARAAAKGRMPSGPPPHPHISPPPFTHQHRAVLPPRRLELLVDVLMRCDWRALPRLQWRRQLIPGNRDQGLGRGVRGRARPTPPPLALRHARPDLSPQPPTLSASALSRLLLWQSQRNRGCHPADLCQRVRSRRAPGPQMRAGSGRREGSEWVEEGWERDEGGHPGKAQHSSRRAATPHRSPDAHRPDKASRPAVYDCYRLPVPITEEGAGGRARSARGPKKRDGGAARTLTRGTWAGAELRPRPQPPPPGPPPGSRVPPRPGAGHASCPGPG